MTTETNSRNVRDLEILAINVPTNGDQEIHHAQYIMVQVVTNSFASWPWEAFNANMRQKLSTNE